MIARRALIGHIRPELRRQESASGTKVCNAQEVSRCGALHRGAKAHTRPVCWGLIRGVVDMDDQPTIYLLSDTELDAVTGGRKGGGGGGGGGNSGTIVEIVEISIGEVVAAATGNSTVTFNLAGIGNNTTANTSSGRHDRR